MRLKNSSWSSVGAAAAAFLALTGWSQTAPAFTQIEFQGLVFSPSVIEAGQEGNLCALNYTQQSHQTTLSFVEPSDVTKVLETQTISIAPGRTACVNFAPVSTNAQATPVVGLIQIVPPGPCRVSTGAIPPGPCRIFGSLEIADTETHTNRLHLEGRLLPAVQSQDTAQ
jgi:hypothetical protein